LRGERDASARATHLEAATRKFLVTTNERKQMSTKTNFKRIALVAVAALGMGVLSSTPSQAVWGGALTVTTTNGTAGLSASGGRTDSTTAGTVSINALSLNAALDSYTVTSVLKSFPSATTAARTGALLFMLTDTATSTGAAHTVNTTAPYAVAANNFTTDSGTAITVKSVGNGYVNSQFKAFIETGTSVLDRVAGTYTYTVIVTPFTVVSGVGSQGTPVQADISFTVTAAASTSQTIDASKSTAFLGSTAGATADAAISALATASSTAVGVLSVRTYNASSVATPESVTVTISGAGILRSGGVTGSSLVIASNGGSGTSNGDIEVLPDGRAGVATITTSTPTRSFGTKTLSFYAVAPATLVASVATPLLKVGSNSDVVRVTAKDSAGISWAGQLYIYASAAADAAVAGAVRATAASSALTCTWDAADDRHECPISSTTAGTAKFKVTNYATAALATAAASGAEVTSNEVTVTVSAGAAATVKLEFDKATYAPGERARIYVTPLDSTGKALQSESYANLLAAGGISTASALTFAGSTTTADSLTAVSITTKANSSSTSGAKAGSMEYTVYMPVNGGTVTISATGGTSLPIAGRVAVTASATITDSGAAALAAVNALATTVASLRTLITTLTNLVLKIQKKVKMLIKPLPSFES